MVDVWKELGLALGRALKPLADMAAGIWTAFGEASEELAKGFMTGAKGIGDAMADTIDSLTDGILATAAEALEEGSPRGELKDASKKLTTELMDMLQRYIPEKGESPPDLATLTAAVAGVVATNLTLYTATYGVTMGLDLAHPVKEMGFRWAAKDLLDSFYLPSVLGPALAAGMWSGVVAPMRMRMNEKFPYLVPGTAVLPQLRAKAILDDIKYKENMRYNAFDADWSDAMLENAYRYPSFSEVRTMIHRGVATWEEAKAVLEKSLIQADYIAKFEELVPAIPGFSDLRRYAIREAFPDATTFTEHFERMKFWMMKQGYSEYFADADWTAHWIIPTTSQADEMLHRGMITEAQHRSLYILNDIRPQDIDSLRALTWSLPGRIDARWLFRWGEIGVSDLRDLLVKAGLDPAHADGVARATAKNQFLSDITRQIGNSKASFVKGYTLESNLRADLDALGLRSEMVEYHIVDALDDRARAIKDEALRTLRAQYARGALTLDEVIAAVTPIIIDKPTRDAWIAALPSAKQVIIMEETFGTEINRMVANAKSDYVRGYSEKEAFVSRLQLLDLPDEVIKYHIMDGDEDRTRKHNDKELLIVEEGYIDDLIEWADVESMSRPILKDDEAYSLYLDEVWLNKHKARRVAVGE